MARYLITTVPQLDGGVLASEPVEPSLEHTREPPAHLGRRDPDGSAESAGVRGKAVRGELVSGPQYATEKNDGAVDRLRYRQVESGHWTQVASERDGESVEVEGARTQRQGVGRVKLADFTMSESIYSLKAKIDLIGRHISKDARGLRVWQLGAWHAEWWGADGRAIVAASATSKEAALECLLKGLIATAAEVSHRGEYR